MKDILKAYRRIIVLSFAIIISWINQAAYSQKTDFSPTCINSIYVLPADMYSQISTFPLTITVKQYDVNYNTSLVFYQNFVYLNNASYFQQLGSVSLNGSDYYAFKFISSNYPMGTGILGSVFFEPTLGSQDEQLYQFQMIRVCPECSSGGIMPSRASLYRTYDNYFGQYVNYEPYDVLDYTSQQSIANLLNWLYGFTAPGVNDYIEALDMSIIGNSDLPAAFGAGSDNHCTCMQEISNVLKTIGETSITDIYSVQDQLDNNIITSCGCLSKYNFMSAVMLEKEFGFDGYFLCLYPSEVYYPVWIMVYVAGQGYRIAYAHEIENGVDGLLAGLSFDGQNWSTANNFMFYYPDSIQVVSNVSNNTFCKGNPVQLSVSGGSVFEWSTGDTTASITVMPDSTTTYYVNVSGFAGCDSISDTITLYMADLPEFSAGEDRIVCAGSSDTLSATEGYGPYTWFSINPEQHYDTSASIVITPDSTNDYVASAIYIADSNTHCKMFDTVKVEVLPVVEADAGADREICIGTQDTLKATGGLTYLWSTGDSTDMVLITPDSTLTYTVTVSNSCFSDTASVSITVVDLPTADAGIEDTICNGQTDTLVATGGETYVWSTGDSTAAIVVSPQSNTTYYVTVFNEAGCADADSVAVVVLESPVIDVGEDFNICTGGSDTLTASGGPPYYWSTGDTTESIIITPDSTTVYTVSTWNENGCNASDSITVTVLVPFEANAGADRSICTGQSDTLVAEGGSMYSWSTGDTTASIVVTPDSTTTYYVTVSDGCYSDTDTVTVTVNGLPEADAGETEFICYGTSGTLTATGGTSYYWSTNETTASIQVAPDYGQYY